MLSLTGDAPAPYPTATHSSSTATRFGASQTSDDGVVIGPIRVGENQVTVEVNVQGLTTGWVDAWIDFNRDGSFSGPWEKIFNSTTRLMQGEVHELTFDVPSWAEIGTTWARFRISTNENLGIGGSFTDGEVEDYQITILPPAESLGTFASPNTVHDATGSALADVPTFAADFDGDGDTDIVSATSSDSTVAWYRNNGTGTFTRFPVGVVGASDDLRSVHAADVDSDGLMDVLVVSVTDNSIYWFRNDGTPASGTWTRSTISSTASGARAVVAADVDRDGDTDVAAVSYLNDKLAWYENNGSESFTERVVNTPDNDSDSNNGNGDVNGPAAVFAADINRDGHVDLVTASGVDGQVAWFQNDGTPSNGGWTRRVIKNAVAPTADPQELSLVVADINGDGDMDVVTANYAEDRIAWFENDGTPTVGTWTRRDVSTAANGAYGVFAADVDSDGDMDVLSASVLDDKIAVYKNNGNGIVFTPVTVSTAADGATSVFAADLNNDGDLDVISGSRLDNKVAWYANQNTAGILITQTNDPLQVSESGTTDMFTVALTSQPASNVVLQLANGDSTEISLSHTSLTFTSANWNTPQTVTVTGVNDFVDDGDVPSTITISVNDASSDNAYDPLPDELVSVVTADNDGAGFTITQTGGSTQVTEAGGTDTFTVVLTSQPTSNVVLDVFSNDTGEATVSVDSLTFTTSNWDAPRTVTVTGVDDMFLDGTQLSTIFIRVNDAQSDNTYDPLPDKTILVTTTDNEVADFTVTEGGGKTEVGENGSGDPFTVVLTGPPSSNVVFTIIVGDSTEASATPTTLTFTPANWNVAQTVVVRGVNDSLLDGAQTSIITIRVNDAQSDNSFDPLPDKTVTVITQDNDVRPPGDYDRDGLVENPADYEIWADQFGSTIIDPLPTQANADGNGDEVVDVADFVVWRKFIGVNGISGSGGGSGGGAEEGSGSVASVLISDAVTTDDSTPIESEPVRTSGLHAALSAMPHAQRNSAGSLRRITHWSLDDRSGTLKLKDLAMALANVMTKHDDQANDWTFTSGASGEVEAAFECDDLLAGLSDFLRWDFDL
jgi:hypothetical protein